MSSILKTSNYFVTAGFFLFVLALAACQKDISIFDPQEVTKDLLLDFLRQAPNPNTKTSFQFSGAVPDTILTTPNGLRVYLTDTEELFTDKTSHAVVPCSTCSNLSVEITEVIRKGDMMARELPGSDEDQQWLESAGAVKVEVFCNGQSLGLLDGRNIKIQIPANAPTNSYLVYSGVTNNDKLVSWKTDSDPVFQAEWNLPQGGLQTGYEILAKQTGWVSAQQPLNATNSSFCVDMPTYYNSDNSLVFLVLENKGAVAVLQPVQVAGKNRFCFDHAPVGYSVKVVSVTKIGEEYWLGYKKTETGTNSVLDFVPNKSTESGVLDFLRSL